MGIATKFMVVAVVWAVLAALIVSGIKRITSSGKRIEDDGVDRMPPFV